MREPKGEGMTNGGEKMEWCAKCGGAKYSDDYDSKLCEDCLEEWAEENEVYL